MRQGPVSVPARQAAGTRVTRRTARRWLVAGGILAGVAVLVALSLAVVYPRVGAYVIRTRVGSRLAARLGRQVTFGGIEVSLGRATLRDVDIRGPLDGERPLVHIGTIEVAFDAWSSLIGRIEAGPAVVDDVRIAIRRDGAGRDNVRDLLARVRSGGAAGEAGAATGDRGRPSRVTISRVSVRADDEGTGLSAMVRDADATWTPDLVVANARSLSVTTPGAPRAELASIELRKARGAAPTVTLSGGELSLWPRLALSGIAGTIVEDPQRAGTYLLEVAGGWGGVPGRLWTARGAFDPTAGAGSLDLAAARFQLERLAPILEKSAIVDYRSTSVDSRLHVEVAPSGARFSGDFNVSGLNVGHPMIADKEVHDLDLSVKLAGSYDAASRTLELVRGDLVARDVPFSITGTVVRVPRDAALAEWSGDTPVDQKAPPMRGPFGIQKLELRLVIPPITCQRVIDAIPRAMAPHIQGYELTGTFHTDVRLAIDWLQLDNLVLAGSVGIDRCKVVEEPEDSPKRLLEPFEHFVEYEQDEWMSFVVGPENPDFVPLADISPNLVKSITTTEDGAFYKHKGFIVSEFRTALLSDLKARAFRHGASSITMQMVKNVLLYRQKTLARKLQELFLTWHVERTLDKDRILEIYFNVIEYGPALYGIGPAALHYFGKHPRDLSPTEAAFFSSILPSPKERYKQYCQGTLTRWTTGKIERILALMLKRGKITQEEYDRAASTPLVFVKDGSETEKQCLDRVKKAIKNTRPTNPLKK